MMYNRQDLIQNAKKNPYRTPYHICNKKYTNLYEENFEDFL